MSPFEEMKFCPRCAKPLSPREEGGRTRLACSAEGCGYVFYGNPVPVVAGIVEHEGKVLLVRNKGWPEKWFGLMTGFLEAGEAPDAAVLRELDEELGLAGEVVSLVGLYPFEQMNQLIIAYHLKATGTVRVGEELETYKAVDPDRLRAWPLATGLAVADWIAARSRRG